MKVRRRAMVQPPGRGWEGDPVIIPFRDGGGQSRIRVGPACRAGPGQSGPARQAGPTSDGGGQSRGKSGLFPLAISPRTDTIHTTLWKGKLVLAGVERSAGSEY